MRSEGTGKRRNGEAEKRWGLLERSPQTPKNFSRVLFGWGFTLAPGPVVPLLYRMAAGILGFAESA